MTTYECNKGGLAFSALCKKCNESLVCNQSALPDGSSVQISKCLNYQCKIKSSIVCGQDMECAVQRYQRADRLKFSNSRRKSRHLLQERNVGDVKKWRGSPFRKQGFNARGIQITTFVEPNESSKTALLFDVSDIESKEVSESVAADWVNLETLQVFVKK